MATHSAAEQKVKKNTGRGAAANSAAKKSSSTSKKSNTSAKKTESASRSSYQKPEQKETGRLSLAASVAIGLLCGFILELSNFDVFGTFGGWIKYGQFGLFGTMAYIFPVFVFLIITVSSFREKRLRWILTGSILFLLICTFSHLVSSFSLNNTDVLSYFPQCAQSRNGGGLIGGVIALGLSLLLSRSGAVIITILGILICMFFLFEEPLKRIFSGISLRVKETREKRIAEAELYGYEEDEDYEAENEFETNDISSEVLDEKYTDRLTTGRKDRRRNVRRTYDEPVYVTEDPDGTVIHLVRSYRKHGRVRSTQLIRTTKKAQPLRDGIARPVRTENKARGISRETDLNPHNANGDEIHEITRRSRNNRTDNGNKGKDASRTFFDDTLITPEQETEKWQITADGMVSYPGESEVPHNSREAAVTRVKEAAVNRRAKEARPVKVHKSEQEHEPVTQDQPAAQEKTPQRTSRSSSSGNDSPKVWGMDPAAPAGDLPYSPPPMGLLARVKSRSRSSQAELEKTAQDLEMILEQFGVIVNITDIQAGPSVVRFEMQPELGTRVNKITSLANDLKLNLGVTEIRIEAPIPGRQAVGIEIPNKNRETVYMRELLEEPTLINHPSKLAFAAGKDISGNVVVADVAKMPHLLVAGTTGSGKSVFLNTILMTILYRARPSEVGLIIIDPKKVEFGIYQGIPHLMKDVVTDPGQAVSTLRWAVNEMTNRYQRMQLSSVRDFKSYNAKVEKGTVNPEEENPRKMNQIVIIIDELADLMMVAKKEAEALICRLAQLARAAGIHLIIATQRPSVDVVTGLIKANVPARVALLVSSQIDSRTIIDMPGAEKLLGYGDMLFYPTGYVKPVRIQGAFVSDDEIQKVVDFLIHNNQSNYFEAESREIEKFMNSQGSDPEGSDEDQNSDSADKYDEYFYEAGKLCIEMGKASSSMLQRRFNLGFNRAARIIDQLEEFGAVGPQNGAKPREILVDTVSFEEMYQSMTDKRNTHS